MVYGSWTVERTLRLFLDALERRRRVTRWIDLYLEVAFVASLLTAIVAVAYRLVPALGLAVLPAPPRAAGLIVLGVLLTGPAAAAAWMARRRPAREAAARADQVLRLEERLSTAAEWIERPQGPLAALLVRDAARRVEGARAERVYPLPAVGYRGGLALALAALAILALAPDRLTWPQVRAQPTRLLGLGDPPSEAAAPAAPPTLDFRGVPRQGEAPLTVYFLGYADGAVDLWEWDFGDGSAPVIGLRQQEHTYAKPGTYTVRLRAGGAALLKPDYIVVGSAEGGPDVWPTPLRPLPQPGPPPVGGPTPRRPDVQRLPHDVTPLDRGAPEMVEKKRAVYVPDAAGSAPAADAPDYERAYADYRRVAEEAIGRDRIPRPLAEYVRTYFERIRP
jgi:hypothetical protein